MFEFIWLNRFKVTFSALYIIATLVLLAAAYLSDNNNIAMFFAVLALPALIFIRYFSQLPWFTTCEIQSGAELCHSDPTVAAILSIPLLLCYTYVLSCIAERVMSSREFMKKS